ncbi:Prp18 domain-containing protein [Coniochaeta sp. 2T2.1]|nr:Prp18 domain-containing protein [Coniochaeta sp. 2T2.1]
MDFASLMAKTLSKSSTPAPAPAPGPPPASKDTASSTTPDTDKSPTPPPPPPAAAPKFISRREAEEARRAAYLAEQQRIEAERQARQNAKRKREEELAEEAKARELKRQKLAEESRRRREEKEAEEERQRRKRLGLPEVAPTQQTAGPTQEEEWSDSESDSLPTLPDSDVRSKLRDMGEPVVLFGETEAARLKRYHKLTGKVVAAPNGPVPTTLPPVQEKDMKVGAVPPLSDRKARRYLYRQLASYFNMVLREWERALAEEGTHDTTAGKQAVAAMLSSKESMKALFRKFEKADLDESILKAIVEIVQAAQERRYVDANDGYLRLSIGKAAWPIGVTMVGIHERSAREKLHNGEKGHVMGDEVTRKYLQSIKRCLTFAQVRWPPEDVRQLMG